MKKRIVIWICCVTMLVAIACPVSASAVSSLDTQQPCSLTLHYQKENQGFSGLEIKIYRVAEFEGDGTYELIAPFDSYPVRIHDITTQKEWRDATQTLVAWVDADGLEPTAVAETDETGTVVFEGLEPGLYLILGVDAETATGTVRFEPFLIFLPTPDENGQPDYDMEANPKSIVVPVITEYRVVKLWKDSGNGQNRPASILVDILKDGALQETVELNAENNWSYSWTTEDTTGRWSVVERNVPAGYTVTVTSNGNCCTITNEAVPEIPDDDKPATGDTAVLWPYALALCLSGIGLVALGSSRKKEKR